MASTTGLFEDPWATRVWEELAFRAMRGFYSRSFGVTAMAHCALTQTEDQTPHPRGGIDDVLDADVAVSAIFAIFLSWLQDLSLGGRTSPCCANDQEGQSKGEGDYGAQPTFLLHKHPPAMDKPRRTLILNWFTALCNTQPLNWIVSTDKMVGILWRGIPWDTNVVIFFTICAWRWSSILKEAPQPRVAGVSY
jgi:hypothetical protein